MNQSDVDETIGYVNKIIDNVRCPTCDRLQGSRMRYPCGHSACDDCVIYAEDCQTCSSPPPNRSAPEAKPDYPLTLAVKNAENLLKACQNLFDVNAFQHKRLSEQLKIEKELFPKCIQAPIKYENKRKSTSFAFKNKENTFTNCFPGEEISTSKENKMENSVSYVQHWLNKNEKNLTRKPFADLNVNTQWTKTKASKQKSSDENHYQSASRKRSHFKTTDKDYSHLGNKRSVYQCDKTSAKVRKETLTSHLQINTSNVQEKCDNDESGIFMDNDPIVIDDSQESIIDKDKKAWLAVLEACKNENTQSTSVVKVNNNKHLNNHNAVEKKEIYKVPFFKKSAIIETCKYCKNQLNSAKPVPITSPWKPVKITIDSDHFVTTITVFNNVQSNVDKNTCNVSVQTNIGVTDSLNNGIDCNKNMSKETDTVDDKSVSASDKQSEDLFKDDRKIFGDVKQKEINTCVVIEESDSDTDIELSGPICVKADVHRSCQELEFGTLTEIVNVKQHESKPRRGPRGHTPTSTDSSEKENYNPNRMRRHGAGKKKSTKK